MTPQEGFESSQYLVGWAQEQLGEIKALIRAASDSNPGTMVVELDKKTGRNELKVKLKPVPHRIRGLTNNIVKDLRDALDQATNAACHLVSGVYKPNRHFPFGESPDDFDTAVTKNQCKHIPTALYPALKGYEPYPTGDGWVGGNNMLRLLGRISGPHKHRFTLQTTPILDSYNLSGFDFRFGSGGGALYVPHINREGDLVIASIGSDGKANIKNWAIDLCISFADAKLKDIPVDTFLAKNCVTIGYIVQDLQSQALALASKR